MVVVPIVAPALTMPFEEPTVAILVLELLQVPLPVASARVLLPPAHTLSVPVIAAGDGFTFSVAPEVEVQPFDPVAVTLYTLAPVAVGVIVVVAHEVQDSPVAPEIPAHVNVGAGTEATMLMLSIAHSKPHVEL